MKKRNWFLLILVVALGAAVYLNWQLAPQVVTADDDVVTDSRRSENLGEATFVDAPQDTETASQQSAVSTGSDYFSQSKTARENTHKDAIKELESIINNPDLSDSAKAEAVSKAAKLTENLEIQVNLENLIKAKGFKEVLVTIGEQETTVVVKSEGLSANEVAIIKDIVVGQLGISSSAIRVIETN
ncbi:MAG: SpoIIIAH-like family protein [Clostridia bacterium]|nr:SpoIIIAH-like family protein [Clostridia bacterium]